MKILQIIVIGFLVVFYSSNQVVAQWSVLNNPSGIYGNVMHAKDADTVLVISESIDIHQSNDGGTTWSTEPLDFFLNTWPTGVHFPTKSAGYIIGGSFFGHAIEYIFKTADGGVTWDSLSTNSWGTMGPLKCVFFVNENIGFIVSVNTGLWKTVDGGVSFSPVTSSPSLSIEAIYFTNAYTGFIIASGYESNGYFSAVYKTENQGITWSQALINSDQLFRNLQFVDANNGFVSIGGEFYKTQDAGQTWSKQTLDTSSAITAISFLNPDVGYIGFESSISKTSNGGITWYRQSMDVPTEIRKIQVINDTVVYAMSKDKVYKTTNGGGWIPPTSIEQPNLSAAIKIYPNPTANILYIHKQAAVAIQSIHLSDISGRVLQTYSPESSEVHIGHLVNGMYFVNISTANGNLIEKIILNK